MPALVRAWSEPTALVREVVRGESRLLVVEVDKTSARLQRPQGPDGFTLLYEEIRSRRHQGLLVAGLLESETDRFRLETGFKGEFLLNRLLFTDLGAFDPALRGGKYKTLRQALGRARREGVTAAPYNPATDAAEARGLFQSWLTRAPKTNPGWIPGALESAGQPPGYLGVSSRDSNGRLLAVSLAYRDGRYAYMAVALSARSGKRCVEMADFTLLDHLRRAGVARVDWGTADTREAGTYKDKFGAPDDVTIYTAWIPVGGG